MRNVLLMKHAARRKLRRLIDALLRPAPAAPTFGGTPQAI